MALTSEKLAPLVQLIRGERVLLDADLAELYGVTTGALNQAVKRNRDRFPDDFMFHLAEDEAGTLHSLRSQTVISNSDRMGLRHLPYAFTEQGVAMLSSVLRSPCAVEVNSAIMRTFVQLRRLMDSNRMLGEEIRAMEEKYDEQFQVVFDAIKQLIADDEKPKRRIGFPTQIVMMSIRARNNITERPPSLRPPDHYPQLRVKFRPIPTGLRPSALGCEARATLGRKRKTSQPQRGCVRTPCRCRNPVGVEGYCISVSQGSSCLTTLGFETESLWDSTPRHRTIAGNGQLLPGREGRGRRHGCT